ncbi:peptidoglycan-binding protein [Streptomyces marokkonensis]|uniref:peptidoglycan-binding protein n=1 Tax=Streptomyces marokkonensis TaxID=324855 RepID=UPI0011F10083|nr:peptidoglycan-binding protein [Streptomyces marokkonensis]
MSRWKELPAELDPRVRRLVVCLRRAKDHSGLSMRQLAAKTGYSASSWERYLGGRSLPPREAVEALASVTGEDPVRLLALRDVAAAARTGEHATSEARPGTAAGETVAGTAAGETVDVPVPEESGRRGGSFRTAVAASVVALVLAASSLVLVTRLTGDDEGRAQPPPVSSAAPAGAASGPSAPSYTCRVERIDGRWYAGLSRTGEAILLNGHAGKAVAEAQCLLHRAGYPPGDIDGIYGPLTERAVKRLQKRAGLVVDGIVGPHTWKVLRG